MLAETFKDLPIVLNPVPNLILPSPHDEFCLTPFFPAFDAGELHRLYSLPKLGPGLGISDVDAYDLAAAQADVDSCARLSGLWGFPVMRRLADVRIHVHDCPIPIVGTFTLRRDCYRGLITDHERVKQRDAQLSDEEGHWETGSIALHPEYQGRGIMGAVGDYILTKWFIPCIKPYPGQLHAGYMSTNIGSAKLHLRLGFRPIGCMVLPLSGGVEPFRGTVGVGRVPGKSIYEEEPELKPLPEGWDKEYEQLAKESESFARRYQGFALP